jgi:hypothetical protein
MNEAPTTDSQTGAPASTGAGARPLIWIALAIALAPLVIGGFPQGSDWLYELVRVSEYRSALADGQLPPAWASNLYAGYGSPIFLFYAPLFLFVASVLGAASGSVLFGTSAALLLFGVIAVVAAGRLATAAVGGEPTAAVRVGIYLYVLHPYLIADLLLRNANAEFAALCLAPLPLTGLLLAEKRPARAIWIVGGGLALVVLTHNLTALVVQALLMLGGVLLYGLRRPRALGSVLCGVFWGLALSAFFWVPAMALKHLVRPGDLLSGKFDFHNQFVSPLSVFGYGEIYGAGLLPACVLAMGAVVAWRALDGRSSDRRLLLLCLGGAAALILMTTRLSSPIWETVPLLAYFQFPWRMQGPLALLTALIGVLVFAEVCRRWPARVVRPAELVIFTLCILNALPQLVAYQRLPSTVRADIEVALTPDGIRSAVHSATVGNEYLPQAARMRNAAELRAQGDPIAASSGLMQLDVLRNSGTDGEIRLIAAEPTGVELRRWSFPDWRVELDGRPADARATPAGTLGLELPPGTHELSLAYRPPPIRRITTWISLAALLGPLVWWIGRALRPR